MISTATSVKVELLKKESVLELARVLLVDDELPSRLAVQTVLQAGGYAVDVAASGAEAVAKLDEREYELVLSELQMESPEAGRGVLSYARAKDYKPAIALIRSSASMSPPADNYLMSVDTGDVEELLSKVANLISLRAARRAQRINRLAVVH